MKIQVDTLYIRELVYEMLRNLEDGKFKTSSGVSRNADVDEMVEDFHTAGDFIVG